MIVEYTGPDSPNPIRMVDISYLAMHEDKLHMFDTDLTHLVVVEFNSLTAESQDGYVLVGMGKTYYEVVKE